MDAGISNFWQVGYGSKLVEPEAKEQTLRYIRTQWDRLEKYDRGMPRGSGPS